MSGDCNNQFGRKSGIKRFSIISVSRFCWGRAIHKYDWESSSPIDHREQNTVISMIRFDKFVQNSIAMEIQLEYPSIRQNDTDAHFSIYRVHL